jgi:hypothetical protein
MFPPALLPSSRIACRRRVVSGFVKRIYVNSLTNGAPQKIFVSQISDSRFCGPRAQSSKYGDAKPIGPKQNSTETITLLLSS